MSAVNLLPDSALHAAPDLGDGCDELALPTQPWHAPPFPDTRGIFEGELEPEFEFDAEGQGYGGSLIDEQGESFDFHDTIPAPPWLDEPGEALEMPVFPAR